MRILILFTTFGILLPAQTFPSIVDRVNKLAFLPDTGELVMDVDAQGNVYVAGTRKQSIDIPGAKVIGTPAPAHGQDMFVVKLDASLDHVLWATIIGGSESDSVSAIRADATGNVYLAGYTFSSDFPVTYKLRPDQERGPIVLKLNPAGDTLLYSVRLSDYGQLPYLNIDSLGAAYVAGGTRPNALNPTSGAYLTSLINPDPDQLYPFLLKINPAGSSLEFATFLSTSPGIPSGLVLRPDQSIAFTSNRTLAVLNATGSQLLFQTVTETVTGSLGIDASGQLYVAGGDTVADSLRVWKYSSTGMLLSVEGVLGGGTRLPVNVSPLGRVVLKGNVSAPAAATRNTMLPCFANQLPPGGSAGVDPNQGGDGLLAVYEPDGSVATVTLFPAWMEATSMSPDGRYLYAVGVGNVYPPILGGVYTAWNAIFRLDLGMIPSGPHLAPACLASGASYQRSATSPGQIMTIYGSNLGPETGVSFNLVNGVVPPDLAGTRVTVDGTPAPVLYAQDVQINFVVPWNARVSGTSRVCVARSGETACLDATARAVAPAIFPRDGSPLVLNLDGRRNGSITPIQRGSYIVLFLTGTGMLTGTSIDGAIAGLPLQNTVTSVTASFQGDHSPLGCTGIGGGPCMILPPIPLDVVYSGSAPTLVAGVTQVNIRVPETSPTGQRSLFLNFTDSSGAITTVSAPVYVR